MSLWPHLAPLGFPFSVGVRLGCLTLGSSIGSRQVGLELGVKAFFFVSI